MLKELSVDNMLEMNRPSEPSYVVKQCNAKTLLTGRLRYAYGLQQTPYCTLCQHEGRENVVSDVTHILGGCPSETLRKLHCMY